MFPTAESSGGCCRQYKVKLLLVASCSMNWIVIGNFHQSVLSWSGCLSILLSLEDLGSKSDPELLV